MAFEIGDVVQGKVTGIMDFGAFVDLGEGKTGMVHISEVSDTYVTNIRDFLTVGQEVTVKVVAITDKGKINLSIKKNGVTPAAVPPPAGGSSDGAERSPRPPRPSAPPNVWNGQRAKPETKDLEGMLNKFKQTSEDKISDLRRSGDARYAKNNKRR